MTSRKFLGLSVNFLFYKVGIWSCEVAEWVKVIAAKPVLMSLIPGTHMVLCRTESCMLSSDFHGTVDKTCAQATTTNKCNQNCPGKYRVVKA